MYARHILSAGLLLVMSTISGLAENGVKAMDEAPILDVIGTMTEAFAVGDIDTVMSTYQPDAVVVGAPGTPIKGEAALRDMFAQFVAAGAAFTYGDHEVIVAGNTALHLMKWTSPTPDGEQNALSVAVLRRQTDGSWKMVIDHPFGDGVMHSNAQ